VEVSECATGCDAGTAGGCGAAGSGYAAAGVDESAAAGSGAVIVHGVIYSALGIALVFAVVAKWSVVQMVREINRLALPGGERLIRERMSLWWWPGYKDRYVRKVYRSLQPYSRLRFVYPGSLLMAFLSILAALLFVARATGGVQ
jgi:hypothetical protein